MISTHTIASGIRRTTFLIVCSIVTSVLAAGSTPRKIELKAPDGSRFTPTGITLLHQLSRGRMVLASSQGVLVTDGSRLLARIDSLPQALAFAGVGDKLYIGTVAGLFVTTAEGASPHRIEIPALNTAPVVTSLAVDARGTLWIGTKGFGLFASNGESLDPVQGAPYISSLAVTGDGSVWIGTNVGLHRWSRDGYHAYSEEIHHEGLTIPDNIVERLRTDSRGNLWVFMSNAVSVIDPREVIEGNDHIDPSTYAYIGAEGNEIYEMIDGPEATRWIASQRGLFLLRDIDIDHQEREHHHGLADVIAPPEGSLVSLVTVMKDLDPDFTGMAPRGVGFTGAGDLLVAGEGGMWRIDRATLRGLMARTDRARK